MFSLLMKMRNWREQVWNWFQNRRHAQKAKIAKTPDKLKPAGSGSETPPTAKVIATAAAPAAASPVQSENIIHWDDLH